MLISNSPHYFGAVDIGGTKIAVGVVRDDGLVVAKRKFPTSTVDGWKGGLKAIGLLLRDCIDESEAVLSSIGIGCTGPVDPVQGSVGKVALLPGWEGCNLIEEMNADTGLHVALENDADAAAVGEWTWGLGQGASRFLYVTVSTGIGVGFIYDGHLYRGANGAHPEMGHHSIDPNGSSCYCGARGCWESLASGTAIARLYREQSEQILPVRGETTAKTVFSLAMAGDEVAQETIDLFIRRLGIGLANLMTMLVPDIVALGGGVMNNMAPYMQATQQYVRLACREVPVDKTLITMAALQQDVGLAGAAAVAKLIGYEPLKIRSGHKDIV